MTSFVYRLAYDRPQPGTREVILKARDPIPTYVAIADFLTRADFLSAESAVSHGERVIRVKLSPGGREKFNQIAERNEEIEDMSDHTMLLLYLNDKPAPQVTLISEPIPGFEFEIRPEAEHIPALLAAFNAKAH